MRRYSGETNLRTYLLLDTSSSMHFHHFSEWSKLRYGIHLVAALVHMLHRQRDAFGLITFDDTIRDHLPPGSSTHHQRMIYGRLEELLEGEEKSSRESRLSGAAGIIHRLAESFERRSLVILFSDLFENVQGNEALVSALGHLRKNRHEVLVIRLQEEKSERYFDFPDGEMQLQDMETGGRVDLNPGQLREAYREQAEDHIRLFRSACGDFGIDFEPIDIQKPFAYALLSWLRKRQGLT